MCARFSLIAEPDAVERELGLNNLERFPPRYNIAPTQPILMATLSAANVRVGVLVRWGLVPNWVKDPQEFSLLLNARSETAVTKPSFKTAMRHRRTLVPASGFYEWRKVGDKKQAYWIKPANNEIVMFGGLMETWSNAEGAEIDSGCILTTHANAKLKEIHHRMPVVIKPEDFDQWLDCKTREPRDVENLMMPVEDGYFDAVAVSDRVNKASNSGPDLQQKIPEIELKKQAVKPVNQQLDLF